MKYVISWLHHKNGFSFYSFGCAPKKIEKTFYPLLSQVDKPRNYQDGKDRFFFLTVFNVNRFCKTQPKSLKDNYMAEP